MHRTLCTLCAAAALLLAPALPGHAKVTITETPEGTVIEITGEPGPVDGGSTAASEPAGAGVAAPSAAAGITPSTPPASAASLDEEIRRLDRERDFLLIRTGTETPEESREKRRMATKTYQEINRLTEERLRLQYAGEGAGGQ